MVFDPVRGCDRRQDFGGESSRNIIPTVRPSLTALTLDSYFERAMGLARYPNVGSNLLYPTLGLGGEIGEILEKIKKLWRDDGVCKVEALSEVQRIALLKETGDVLWYICALSKELGSTLKEVAQMNIGKLEDRQERGTLAGSGDNR